MTGLECRDTSIKGEIYHLDKMLTALVEILEEKGIMTYDEWETRIRHNIEEARGLTKFEDLED